MSSEPSFDLVVATIGRASVLSRFLESVRSQAQPRLRVIIVDQNPDDRLAEVIAPFGADLSIVRLQSPPGLSRARNVGLRHVDADVVAFPDDDCWYPRGLLESVAAALARHPDWDGISVRARDASGSLSSMRWDGDAGPIDRFNVWRRAISFSFFLRSQVVSSVGDFDEELGVGSGTPWRSGEESDYLLRALDAGCSLQFEPSLFVYHESPKPAFDREASRDAYLRGVGHGEVLHRRGYPLWFVSWRVIQLAGGAAAFLVLGRLAESRYYFSMAFGRARGWLDAMRHARTTPRSRP